MKRLLASISALVAFGLTASASLQVSVINTDLETWADALVNSSGVVYSQDSATVAVGFFTLSDAQIQALFAEQNVAAIAEAFVDHGTTPRASFGGVGLSGLFTAAFDENVAGPPQAGSNVYVVIGSGGTLFSPTSELLIFKSNTLFSVDTGPSPTTIDVTFRNTAGTLIVGSFGAFSTDLGVGLGSQPAFSTAEVIPEPSTYALLGLGALAGFVAYRRRR